MRHHGSLVPEPLSHKFQERLTKKAAVDKWKAKKRTVAECFPPGRYLYIKKYITKHIITSFYIIDEINILRIPAKLVTITFMLFF